MTAGRPKLHRQRELVTRMVIEAIRTIAVGFWGAPDTPIDFSDLMLCMAVVMSQSQGRLMTPAKLGMYVGIPRATAIRRLAALQVRGMVVVDPETNTVHIPEPLLDTDTALKVVQDIQEKIHATCFALSKLDARMIEKASA